jgi:ribonuclease HIII
VQVAAASIVARAAFLRELEGLSKTVGMTLPKGAGSIVDAAGRSLLMRRPDFDLGKIAKLHFKNSQRVRQTRLV